MTRSRQPTPRSAQTQAISDLLQRGLAHHQAGRSVEAASIYNQVLARDPRQPAANHLLGLILLQQGNAAAAVDRISRALKGNPGDAQYLSNLGVALNAAGRSEEAVTAQQRAIAAKPGFAEAFSNLGMAYRALRRFDDAATATRQAIQLKPNEAGFHFNLGNALRDAGRLFDAEAAFRRALELRPGYSAATSAFAMMLDEQGRAEEALDLVEAALTNAPQDARLRLRRSRSLYYLGRLEDAVASFDRTIALNPEMGEAHLQRAYMVRHEARDHVIDAMETLFRSGSAPIEDRIFAGFGLGKALTDLGEHRAAIAAFSDANRMNRRRTSFSLDRAIAELQADVSRFDDLVEPSTADAMSAAAPIFVVGLPRAGKTTIEAILARHPDVAGAGELPTMGRLVREFLLERQETSLADIPAARFVELGRAYVEETECFVPPGKRPIDTMPSNYRHLGIIRRALPHARIIHCVRDPAEHCVAIFEKYLTGPGYEYADDMDELQSYHAAYRGVMDAWRKRLATSMHDIDLGSLASDRAGGTEKLLQFCGLAWDDACLADAHSEPQHREWSRDRITQSRAEHMAAWREVRPQLWP